MVPTKGKYNSQFVRLCRWSDFSLTGVLQANSAKMLICRAHILYTLLSIVVTLYKSLCIELSSSSLAELTALHNNEDQLKWYTSILEAYQDGSNLTYKELDVVSLAAETSESLSSKIFEPRRAALAKLVNNAENITKHYQWNKIDTITKDSVDYTNGTDFELTYSPKSDQEPLTNFPIIVDVNISTVHVPVDIYHEDKATLIGIDWSDQLDKYFKEGAKEVANDGYEELKWQYFGSQDGFVRNYPGAQWPKKDEGEVDLYDARRRPWFTQAASSPKDVLIMIDMSGSTLGQTLYFMQQTVRKLMDTLSEDDFVQVANFSSRELMNDSGRLGPSCFPEFIQATSFNKRLLLKYVDRLDNPDGQADYNVALEYAYQSFKKFDEQRKVNNSGLGAECSKIIIILTDGGITKPEDVIYTNDPDKKIRIFTFAVGLSPSPVEVLKWLACEHGGYFAYINSIGNIDQAVQRYSDRLSQVLAHESKAKSVLTGSYKDEWASKWTFPDTELGVGMVTTLTQPVFNRTDEANITLLGVMAYDVALSELDKFVPFRELGPLGYMFVINRNGFVVSHPELLEQPSWSNDPPSLDLVDVEEVENADAHTNILDLRNNMIEKMVETVEISNVGAVLKNMGNPAYFLPYKKTYSTKTVSTTAYRMALVYTGMVGKVLSVSTDYRVSVLDELKDQGYFISFSKWSYCDKVEKIHNDTVILTELKKLIEKDEGCNHDMINHLLWDASIIFNSNLLELVNSEQVASVSMTTAGGLTVSFPSPSDTDSVQFESHFSEPSAKKAFANKDLFIYSIPHNPAGVKLEENTTSLDITIHKAVYNESEEGDNSYIFAVAGVTLDNMPLVDALINLETPSGESVCNETSRCYLVDDGGFIIADSNLILDQPANQTTSMSRWLGDVDRSVMLALFDSTDDSPIYIRHTHYDYQAVCVHHWLEELEGSSAMSYRIPTVSQLMEMLLTQLTTAVTFMFSWQSSFAQEPLKPLPFGQRYELCTTVSYQYYYSKNNPSEQPDQVINFHQDNCHRQIETKRLEGTNLILVVADMPDGFCDSLNKLPQAPVQLDPLNQDVDDPSLCQRHLRKREPPTICFDTDKKNFTYPCAACKQTPLSAGVLILSISLLYYLRY